MSNRDAWQMAPVWVGLVSIAGIGVGLETLSRGDWHIGRGEDIVGSCLVGIGILILGFLTFSIASDIRDLIRKRVSEAETESGWLPSKVQVWIFAFLLFLPMVFLRDRAVQEVYFHAAASLTLCVIVRFGVLI